MRCRAARARHTGSISKNGARRRRFASGSVTGLFRGLHIDDLDAAILFRERLAAVLELGLAVANGDQVLGRQPVMVDQVALDRLSAALGQTLVIFFGALGVGVAGYQEHAVLE